ncbi:MAG: GHMP kinase [Anaerolineae bacterium]|nr:MAG: GHMP kinase [Anaerolineae bacterium]
MIVRSKAPLRVSFAGGGTDVSPYAEERGGCVLNCTIDKYAYASLIPQSDDEIRVESLDYDVVADYSAAELSESDGKLDLVKAVIRHFGHGEGMELFLHSDAPPGSGLGSSSAMVVALIGLFKSWKRLPLTDYELAELAYKIERIDVGIQGGRQDQYAATFGGFNFIEFYGKAVVVNPLRIPAHTLNELEYHLMLCYTGSTRLSANILKDQVEGYVRRVGSVTRALDENKNLAEQMKRALLRGELDDFGAYLHQAWEAKKRFATHITNPHIDQVYDAARRLGALGGKITGAGGGGYLLLYCPFRKRHIIAEQLEKMGGQVVGFGFEFRGLQTWQTDGQVCYQ